MNDKSDTRKEKVTINGQRSKVYANRKIRKLCGFCYFLRLKGYEHNRGRLPLAGMSE